ncbi:MAG: hypothetical protein ACPGU7_12325, partial [Gammaproteobacteria bacterium]
MKPDTTTAMHELIGQIREALPFGMPESQVCIPPCSGCSMKLLGFLETELDGWEYRLAEGEKPGLKELSNLARTGRRIHKVLERNGVVAGA